MAKLRAPICLSLGELESRVVPAVLGVESPTALVALAAPATSDAALQQTIRKHWEKSATMDFGIRNTGTTTITGWTVSFDSPFEIAQLINARLVSQVGNRYTVQSLPTATNRIIRPNATAMFTIVGRFDPGTDLGVSNVVINNLPAASNGFTGGNTGGSTTGTVTQTLRSDWGTGSTIDLRIANTGTTPMRGWTVEFDADFLIVDYWNMQQVSHVGTRYVFRNIPNLFNAIIPAKGSTVVGFNISYDLGTSLGIRNIKLNGINQPGGMGGSMGYQSGSTRGQVIQTVKNIWETGSSNDITIRNLGTTVMRGWTIEFDADFDIKQVWNAQLVSHVGTRYVFKSFPGFYNTNLNPGASRISFGFNTEFTGFTDPMIRNITINGVASL